MCFHLRHAILIGLGQDIFPVQGFLEIIKGVDSCHRGNFIADALDLIIKVAVADKDQFYGGIVQDELQFIDADGGIDRCQYGPGLLNRQVEHQPFRTVIAEDCDLVAAFNASVVGSHAEMHESGTQLVHGFPNLAGAVFLPDTAFLLGGEHVIEWGILQLPVDAIEESGWLHVQSLI